MNEQRKEIEKSIKKSIEVKETMVREELCSVVREYTLVKPDLFLFS